MKDLKTITGEGLNATQKEFLALLQLAGWTMAEAARELKVSRSTITQILKGKNTPRESTMELLRNKTEGRKYPVRTEMVVMDKPASFRSTVERAREQIVHAINNLHAVLPAPVISWARGGEGAYYEDQGADVPRIYVPCKDPNCYVLQLEGDSMHPVYLEGDLLVVAPNLVAQNNDLVILKTTEEEVMFKRMKHPRKGEFFEFHSFNPHHPPIFLRPDQIYRVSVVHSVIRPLKEKLRAMAISESGDL